MERTTASRFDPRAALAILGLVFVVAAVWAATALASGGTSGTQELSSGSSGDGSQSTFVQDSNGNGAAPSRDDCPERRRLRWRHGPVRRLRLVGQRPLTANRWPGATVCRATAAMTPQSGGAYRGATPNTASATAPSAA